MIIGARGSELAQWQANWIADRLRNAGLAIDTKIISTVGDRNRDQPLNQLGVQGVFTKEIEEALLNREIDVAVHSLKDMSLEQPEGLAIVAVSQRVDPADLLIARKEIAIDSNEFGISETAIVGSSAVRRANQLKARMPTVRIENLRGNVPTRLEKLRTGKYDAIFLAAAGIVRLEIDLAGFSVKRLSPEWFLPSPGQGALAIEMRSDDPHREQVQSLIHHEMTATAVKIERSLLKSFGGGCSLPLGAYARYESDKWILDAFWGGDENNPIWMKDQERDPGQLSEKMYRRLAGTIGSVA